MRCFNVVLFLDAQNRIDVEVTLIRSNSRFSVSTVIFNMVCECTSMQDGKINLDGLGYI